MLQDRFRGFGSLVVLLICFWLGSVAGFLLGVSAQGSGIADFFSDYFQLAAQGEIHASFLSVLWNCVRWPLVVALLGFSALGIVGIPVAFLLRGFLLSYAAASLAVSFGAQGVMVSGVLFAVTVLFEIPILFLFGSESFSASLGSLSASVPTVRKGYRPEVVLSCLGLTTVAIALQWSVAPSLLSSICVRLFT